MGIGHCWREVQGTTRSRQRSALSEVEFGARCVRLASQKLAPFFRKEHLCCDWLGPLCTGITRRQRPSLSTRALGLPPGIRKAFAVESQANKGPSVYKAIVSGNPTLSPFSPYIWPSSLEESNDRELEFRVVPHCRSQSRLVFVCCSTFRRAHR